MIKKAMIEKVFNAMGLLPLARHTSQVSVDFLKGMALRMSMSREKYGDYRDAYPDKLDAMASGLVRIERYLGPKRFEAFLKEGQRLLDLSRASAHRREHGNTEYLIDAANFLMIEFMAPLHPDAHFKSEDSGASPGRVDVRGTVSEVANTTGVENVRLGGTNMRTSGGFYKKEGD